MTTAYRVRQFSHVVLVEGVAEAVAVLVLGDLQLDPVDAHRLARPLVKTTIHRVRVDLQVRLATRERALAGEHV